MDGKISVIVRSKNEENTLQSTLESILDQSQQPREIILADNLSTDKTREIAKKYHCKVVNIPEPFNHAKSCNLPIEIAKGELVVLMNGHTRFVKNNALQEGQIHFSNAKVAGVYGCIFGDKRASIWEQIDMKFSMYCPKGVEAFSHISLKTMGSMATICCMFRKDLWNKYPFNEEISMQLGGGEDIDWSYHFMEEGYQVILDPNFSVFHCHGENLLQLAKRRFIYASRGIQLQKKYLLKSRIIFNKL